MGKKKRKFKNQQEMIDYFNSILDRKKDNPPEPKKEPPEKDNFWRKDNPILKPLIKK